MIVQHQVETRLVCPAELDQARALKPAVPADAKLTANPAASAWLGALTGWADQVASLFDDAAAACRAATLLDKAAPARSAP